MESLEQYFDLAFAAPNGIQKLRELILTLAMQGKLVPQNSDDPPASELLKQIEAEKRKMEKEGKIKPSKPLPEIQPEEVPYELPKGWEWVRLGNISQVVGGFAYKSESFKVEGSKQVLRLGNIRPDSIRLNEKPVFIDDHLGEATAEFCLLKNDILITMTGTRAKRDYLYSVLINENPMNGVLLYLNQRVGAIRLFFDARYVNCALKVEILKDAIFLSATGSANQANVGISTLREWLVPLPPLPEQHRIVAKIDQLMARCNELETLRTARDQQRLTVHRVAISQLLTAKTPDEFKTTWRFITQHFSELYTVKANVTELRKAILQLAVMGKLVPQDLTDPPASELLKQIEVEKRKMEKEGKIKPSKPLPEIQPEEVPYELPKGWEWVRIDDLCAGITSGSTPPNNIFSDKEGIPFLKVYNIRNQKIDFQYKSQYITEEYHLKLKRSCLIPGDVIMNIVGPPLGKVAIIPDEFLEYNCNQAIVFFRPIIKSLNKYLYLYLLSGRFLDKIDLIGTAGQDNISVTKSRSILIPLPPLPEQHRIVAKIDQLMALCNQLEQHIDAATAKQTALLNAVMAGSPPTAPTSGGL